MTRRDFIFSIAEAASASCISRSEVDDIVCKETVNAALEDVLKKYSGMQILPETIEEMNDYFHKSLEEFSINSNWHQWHTNAKFDEKTHKVNFNVEVQSSPIDEYITYESSIIC